MEVMHPASGVLFVLALLLLGLGLMDEVEQALLTGVPQGIQLPRRLK